MCWGGVILLAFLVRGKGGREEGMGMGVGMRVEVDVYASYTRDR